MGRYFILLAQICLICACTSDTPLEISPGVSIELAEYRVNAISDVSYDLFFSIPKAIESNIPAKLQLSFQLSDISQPLVLDFKVDSVQINEIKKPS